MHAQMLSRVRLFATQWTVTHQSPLSMEFYWEEYWSGLPFPPLGDFSNPGLKPASAVSPELAGRFFTTEPPGKPLSVYRYTLSLSLSIYIYPSL